MSRWSPISVVGSVAQSAVDVSCAARQAWLVNAWAERDWKTFDSHMRWLHETISKYPRVAAYHRLLAFVQLLLDRPEEAAEEARVSLSLDPVSVSGHKILADAYFHLRHLDWALGEYRATLDLKPSIEVATDCHLKSADAYLSLGLLDQATVAARMGLALQPDSSIGHYVLGHVLSSRGSFQEAVDEFRMTVYLDPGNTECHYDMGRNLEMLGRYAESVTCYAEFVRRSADTPAYNPNLVDTARARIAELRSRLG